FIPYTSVTPRTSLFPYTTLFRSKGAYTWSKAINMTDENGWASVAWNWGPSIERNRARAGYDRTHVFQLGYVWELPIGHGKRFLTDRKSTRLNSSHVAISYAVFCL